MFKNAAISTILHLPMWQHSEMETMTAWLFDGVKENGGLCIAVDNGEGCAIDAILHAHLFVHDASKALGLLLDPEVCAAALRY